VLLTVKDFGLIFIAKRISRIKQIPLAVVCLLQKQQAFVFSTLPANGFKKWRVWKSQ